MSPLFRSSPSSGVVFPSGRRDFGLPPKKDKHRKPGYSPTIPEAKIAHLRVGDQRTEDEEFYGKSLPIRIVPRPR